VSSSSAHLNAFAAPQPTEEDLDMKTVLSSLLVVLFAVGTYGSARADATDLFNKKCAGCHGKDGKGDTTMGRKLNMRNLADPKVQAAATDEQWTKVILEGVKGAGGKNVMPASKITDAEVKEIVKLLRALKK
jgi:mono/diheme cytochrome c family protein